MQEDICSSIYKKYGEGVNAFLMLNKYIVQYNIMAKSYQLPLENVSLWKETAGRFVNEQLYNSASVYTEYFGSDSAVEECMRGYPSQNLMKKFNIWSNVFIVSKLRKRQNWQDKAAS